MSELERPWEQEFSDLDPSTLCFRFSMNLSLLVYLVGVTWFLHDRNWSLIVDQKCRLKSALLDSIPVSQGPMENMASRPPFKFTTFLKSSGNFLLTYNASRCSPRSWRNGYSRSQPRPSPQKTSCWRVLVPLCLRTWNPVIAKPSSRLSKQDFRTWSWNRRRTFRWVDVLSRRAWRSLQQSFRLFSRLIMLCWQCKHPLFWATVWLWCWGNHPPKVRTAELQMWRTMLTEYD